VRKDWITSRGCASCAEMVGSDPPVLVDAWVFKELIEEGFSDEIKLLF